MYTAIKNYCNNDTNSKRRFFFITTLEKIFLLKNIKADFQMQVSFKYLREYVKGKNLMQV